MKAAYIRAGSAMLLAAILVVCSSCSYEEKHKTEVVVEKAISQFHTQLNDQRYHEIYLQAEAELRGRVTEADFVAQLASAHQQLGKTDSKPLVVITGGVSRALRKAFDARELVPDGEVLAGDIAIGQERSMWAVENSEAKLVSYDFHFVCTKPCAVGFGIGPEN